MSKEEFAEAWHDLSEKKALLQAKQEDVRALERSYRAASDELGVMHDAYRSRLTDLIEKI